MHTRIAFLKGRQVITDGLDGLVRLPIPDDHKVLHAFEVMQSQIDHNIMFDLLVALQEIAACGDDDARDIASTALAAYDLRRTAQAI